MTHHTRIVEVDGQAALIDVELVPLIEGLWNLGIATSASCQGSVDQAIETPEDMSAWGYIQFPDVEDFRRFLDLFANTELSSRRFRTDEGYRQSTSLTWEWFVGVKRSGAGDTDTTGDLVKLVARVGFPAGDIPSMAEIVARVRQSSVPSELREAYLETKVSIEIEPERLVDARSVIDQLQLPAFVITAWNPFSEELTDDLNRARNLDLLAALLDVGATVHRAIGASPSGEWSGESFMVMGITKTEATEFGRRFGQHAVFELTRSGLGVIACDGSWSDIRRWDSLSA